MKEKTSEQKSLLKNASEFEKNCTGTKKHQFAFRIEMQSHIIHICYETPKTS